MTVKKVMVTKPSDVILCVAHDQIEKIVNGRADKDIMNHIIECKTTPKKNYVSASPYRVYIYCPIERRSSFYHLYVNTGIGRIEHGDVGHWRIKKNVLTVNNHLPTKKYDCILGEGKIIGEFSCNGIKVFPSTVTVNGKEYDDSTYGWNVNGLKIYSEPVSLECFEDLRTKKPIKKFPGSIAYVKRVKG